MVPGWLFCGCSCWALAPFLVWFVSFGVLLFPSRGKIRVSDRGMCISSLRSIGCVIDCHRSFVYSCHRGFCFSLYF